MNVSVAYFAIFREQRGVSHEKFTTEAQSPAELYSELRTQYGFTLDPKWVRVAVNDEFAPMDGALRDGDQVIFLPPVAGG